MLSYKIYKQQHCQKFWQANQILRMNHTPQNTIKKDSEINHHPGAVCSKKFVFNLVSSLLKPCSLWFPDFFVGGEAFSNPRLSKNHWVKVVFYVALIVVKVVHPGAEGKGSSVTPLGHGGISKPIPGPRAWHLPSQSRQTPED